MKKFNDKKRIAFVTPIYLPANIPGSSAMVRDIAESLARHGHDVSVITSDALTARWWYDPIFGKRIKKRKEIVNGVTVYRLRCNQLLSMLLWILARVIRSRNWRVSHYVSLYSDGPWMRGLRKLITSGEFDVIHASPMPLLPIFQVCQSIQRISLRKPKFIITPFFHEYMDAFYNPLLREVFLTAEKIHTVSLNERNTLVRRFSISRDKIVYIPLFLITSGLLSEKKAHESAEKIKNEYGLTGKKIILFAGNKGCPKGAIDLLFAVDMLRKKDASYILLAMGGSTREWEDALQKVKKNTCINLPYCSGHVKESFFAACDIFCMPSQSESFGIVYLEAWHKRKSTIGASIPAVQEMFGKSGVTVPFGNKTILIDKIRWFFEDADRRKLYGERGYSRLRECYTFASVEDKYVSLIVKD